jgi:hypothetical protein
MEQVTTIANDPSAAMRTDPESIVTPAGTISEVTLRRPRIL